VGRLPTRAAVGPVRVHPVAEATVRGRALLRQGQLIRPEREAEAAALAESLSLPDRIVAGQDRAPRSSANMMAHVNAGKGPAGPELEPYALSCELLHPHFVDE
jgi:hypothetical protein